MSSSFKVLIDGNGLQASVHLGTHPNKKWLSAKGKRLNTFLSIIKDLECEISFTKVIGSENTDNILSEYSALIVTTRLPLLPEQTGDEIEIIHKFVKRGGGLLVMSNHPWSQRRNPIPDKKIAARFSIELTGPVFPVHGGRRGLTEIDDKDLRAHPITDGLCGPIVFNNCCRIKAGRGNVLATLPGEKFAANIFAIAIDIQEKGRVVVTTDSGFIGDEDTEDPGPGLIDHGNNRAFMRHVIEWLLKLR